MGVDSPVVNIDGPAETGIGRTLILLDERRHIPRAIVFILPEMQDWRIDIGRIQGLKDFALLQGRHDLTGIDIDPDGVAFAVLLLNICVPLIDLYTQPPIFGMKESTKNSVKERP